MLATALLPDCRYEAALVLIGETGTGKSTICEVLPWIFGDARSCLSMKDLRDPNGYKLAMLEHKMINVSSELNTLEFEDSGLFKQLVSGEPFTARPIYGRPFEMSSTATFVFLANSLPRFKQGTQAEVRRLLFVRCDRKPEIIDTTLKSRMRDEAPGVFLQLVRRCQRLLAGDSLAGQRELGTQTSRRFAISNDPIGHFVKDRCVLGRDKQCQKDQLLSEFDDFRNENGLSDKLSGNHFFQRLYERYPSVYDSKIRVGGERVRIIKGIEIRDD